MIILVTGGAGAVKAALLKVYIGIKKDVVYIATSKTWDKEMNERIKRHKERRPSYGEPMKEIMIL